MNYMNVLISSIKVVTVTLVPFKVMPRNPLRTGRILVFCLKTKRKMMNE